MKDASQAEWNGTLSNIKIFSTTYSELYNDLKNVPSRERGERIRMLAMLGLQSLKLTAPSDKFQMQVSNIESAAHPSTDKKPTTSSTNKTPAAIASHESSEDPNSLAKNNDSHDAKSVVVVSTPKTGVESAPVANSRLKSRLLGSFDS